MPSNADTNQISGAIKKVLDALAKLGTKRAKSVAEELVEAAAVADRMFEFDAIRLKRLGATIAALEQHNKALLELVKAEARAILDVRKGGPVSKDKSAPEIISEVLAPKNTIEVDRILTDILDRLDDNTANLSDLPAALAKAAADRQSWRAACSARDRIYLEGCEVAGLDPERLLAGDY